MGISAMMTHKGKATKDIVLVTVLQKTNSKICCQQAGDPGRPFTKAGEKNSASALKVVRHRGIPSYSRRVSF